MRSHRTRSTWPAPGLPPRRARPTLIRSASVGHVLVLALVLVLVGAGCSNGDTASTTAADETSSTASDGDLADPAGGEPAPTDDAGSAAVAAEQQASTAGDAIVEDGTVEVPGPFGGTAVYEFRDVRLTAPIEQVACPGGRPVNAQRLVVDLTAYLVPPDAADPNVERDDEPAAIPYVSQLPEVVLIGVGEQDTANDRWFVGISPVNRLLQSAPNTYLRPAPDGPATDCAILGWEPTEVPEAVVGTELLALSTGFVPADFDPADYQVRIGRGAEFAYCWPLDQLSDAAELGQCR